MKINESIKLMFLFVFNPKKYYSYIAEKAFPLCVKRALLELENEHWFYEGEETVKKQLKDAYLILVRENKLPVINDFNLDVMVRTGKFRECQDLHNSDIFIAAVRSPYYRLFKVYRHYLKENI